MIMHCGQPVEQGRKNRVTQEVSVSCLVCGGAWIVGPQRSGW